MTINRKVSHQRVSNLKTASIGADVQPRGRNGGRSNRLTLMQVNKQGVVLKTQGKREQLGCVDATLEYTPAEYIVCAYPAEGLSDNPMDLSVILSFPVRIAK